MDFLTVPSFYFNPQIVLVDDDICLLDTLHTSLSRFFEVVSFESPTHFLNSMEQRKKILDIVYHTRELNENSSSKLSIVNLNYQLLVEHLQNAFINKVFVSVGFFDYFMPEMTGIECIHNMNDSFMYKVLLTSSLDNKDVISAFNEKSIQHYIPKTCDDLVDEMRAIILKNHLNVVEELNKIFFGDFYKTSPYVELFSHEKFINLYKHIMMTNNIQFSCVYESGGSMVMYDQNLQKRFLNIYKADEVKNVLFESHGFNHSVSDFNRKLCKEFKLLVNYKNDVTGSAIGSFLSNTLTDTFDTLILENETYYITYN